MNGKELYNMEKRIFICSEQKFPRNSAGANYIQYLGCALLDIGYDVYVMGFGSERDEDYSIENDMHIYNNIKYKSIENAHKDCNKFLLYNVLSGKYAVEQLKKWEIKSGDIVVVYSKDAHFINPIRKYCKKITNISIVICVVEWYQAMQFKKGILDWKYWYYLYSFHYVVPKMKNIIVISKCLENHFSKKDCNVFRIPIMADPYEYNRRGKRKRSEINIIYSGSVGKKDSIKVMVEALYILMCKKEYNVKIHFTGSVKEKIKKVVQNDRILDELRDNMVFHPWLSYNQLIDLYKNMDFLLIAREDTRFTRSNFPSKVPEALCHGIIPIVSRVGDYTDGYLVDGKNSIIFEKCNSIDCSAALLRAIKMGDAERLIMMEEGYKLVDERFSYKVWEESIYQFLSEIED